MVGFHRKFCPTLSSIITPLTDLISPKVPFVWDVRCRDALDKVKEILTNFPCSVSFRRLYSGEFLLYLDSWEVGAGASLMQQEGADGIEHPVCYYYSKKYNYDRHQ